jgi:hypothetical protein
MRLPFFCKLAANQNLGGELSNRDVDWFCHLSMFGFKDSGPVWFKPQVATPKFWRDQLKGMTNILVSGCCLDGSQCTLPIIVITK